MTAPPGHPPGLVVIDLDGTLIDDSDAVDPETVELLHRASEIVPLVIATGRPSADALRWACRAAAQYVVPLNGAALIRVADSRRLWHAPALRPGLLALLARLGHVYGVTVHYHALDAWYIERPDPTTEPYAQRHGLAPLVVDWRTIPSPVHQAELIGPPLALAAVRAALPSNCVPTVASDGSAHYLDVSPPGVDKAAAVAQLLTHLGHSWRDVLAIGNGQNDVCLFACAATSVAVDNSHSALLHLATHRLTLAAGGPAVRTALRAFVWREHPALAVLGPGPEGAP